MQDASLHPRWIVIPRTGNTDEVLTSFIRQCSSSASILRNVLDTLCGPRVNALPGKEPARGQQTDDLLRGVGISAWIQPPARLVLGERLPIHRCIPSRQVDQLRAMLVSEMVLCRQVWRLGRGWIEDRIHVEGQRKAQATQDGSDLSRVGAGGAERGECLRVRHSTP